MIKNIALLAALLSALLTAGCPGPRLTNPVRFVSPDSQSLEASRAISEDVNGAVTMFNQRTGRPVLVRSGTPVEPAERIEDLPVPLAASRGTTATDLHRTLIDFLERYGAVWGLTHPSEELQAVNEPENPELTGPLSSNPNQPGPISHSLRLVQTHRGVRIYGRYATAIFDHEGGLRSVVTRLLPTPALDDVTASFTSAEALNFVAAAIENVVGLSEELGWMRAGFAAAEKNVELVLMPEAPLDPLSNLQLVYVVRLRRGLDQARIILDARSGDVLEALSTTPSEWFDDGALREIRAFDEVGALISGVATTVEGTTSYMGFGSASNLFRAGQFFAISDSAGRADRSLTYYDVLRIPTDGGNSWQTDRIYSGGRRAATSANVNVKRALQWWRDRGWFGWDNRGSALWVSVNNNKNADGSPNLNAWGGGGIIQVGDGRVTGSNFTTAGSLEVMGHELMHSITGVAGRFEYAFEPGAINESMSDFFGAALTVAGDRFNNPTIGEDIGWTLRDFEDPTRMRLPDRYSAFVATEGDAGGVHTNSSILNKTLWLMVQGGEFRGYNVTGRGFARTESMVRGALTRMRWDPTSTMEEFGAGVLAWCEFNDLLAQILRAPRVTDVCSTIERAMMATEIFAGGPSTDLSLDSMEMREGRMLLRLTNRSAEGAIHLSNFEVTYMDELGETTSTALPTSFGIRPVEGSEYREATGVLPGHSVIAEVNFTGPTDTDRLARRINVGVVPHPSRVEIDRNRANNWKTLRVASDYIGLSARWDIDPTRDNQPYYRGNLRNVLGLQVGRALRAVFLVRDTADGPFRFWRPEAVEFLETCEPNCSSSRSYLGRPIAWMNLQAEQPADIVMNGSHVAGTGYTREVWFDERGGLPELAGRFQIYMLVDADDVMTETNETNNLMCLNCKAEDWHDDAESGITVRFGSRVDIDRLFPGELASLRPAARKLRAPERPLYETLRINVPELRYRIPFDI